MTDGEVERVVVKLEILDLVRVGLERNADRVHHVEEEAGLGRSVHTGRGEKGIPAQEGAILLHQNGLLDRGSREGDVARDP